MMGKDDGRGRRGGGGVFPWPPLPVLCSACVLGCSPYIMTSLVLFPLSRPLALARAFRHPHLSLVLFVSTTAPPPLTSSLSSLAPLPPLFLLRANPSAHNQTGPFFGTQVSNLSTPTANQCLPLPPAYYSTCVCAPPNRLFYWKRSRPTPRRPLFSPPFSVP